MPTPKGLPYPAPTDPVAQGAANIRSLAEAVDPLLTTVTLSPTPPAAPWDGMIWAFPADATNGLIWFFRYHAGSPNAYKGEFVGGSALIALLLAAQTSAAVNAWTNVGPDIIVPLTGEYEAAVSCRIKGGSTTLQAQVGVANASSSLSPIGTTAGSWLVAAPSGYESLSCRTVIPPIGGGSTLRVVGFQDGVIGGWDNISLALLPRRVGW